jgi:tRNA dimethylallyltransferase
MVARKIEPIIVIVGETASGKSDLAMFIARRFNGEIINADSWSVYKGFDIGTSKPSKNDQDEIKHYLIDVAKPKEGYSAAIFKRQAKKAIASILNSNKVPIIVGGSGLYIDSLIYNYSFLPPSTKEVRLKYGAMSNAELIDEINSKGYSTEGLDTCNKRRLIRLLENNGIRPTSQELRSNTLIIGLKLESEQLLKNIELRTSKMFENGLENEVLLLSKEYDWDIEPMKGIGYREFEQYFNGSQNITETREQIIRDSIKLSKKQRTWFKRNNSIQWLSNRGDIVAIVTTFLNKYSE